MIAFHKRSAVLSSSLAVQRPAHQSKAVCALGRESHSEGLEKGHQTGRGNAQVDRKITTLTAAGRHANCESECPLKESRYFVASGG